MKLERRRHSRLLPKETTFAALGRKYTRVGKIKDISIGGLSFEYIVGEDTKQQPSQVDIFMTGDVFHIYDVPCKLIYDIDIQVPHVKNNYVKILTTRRCGVQFGELNEEDRFQLELFLEAHIIGFA
jgi:hypothetical protein